MRNGILDDAAGYCKLLVSCFLRTQGFIFKFFGFFNSKLKLGWPKAGK